MNDRYSLFARTAEDAVALDYFRIRINLCSTVMLLLFNLFRCFHCTMISLAVFSMLALITLDIDNAYAPAPFKSQPKRSTRSLIFPETTPTRVQFICGIGIPVEHLPYESVISGYVLKAEYFLPTKAEQLTTNYLSPQTIHKRSTTILQTHENHLIKGMSYGNYSYSSYKKTRKRRSSDAEYVNDYQKRKARNVSLYRWAMYRGVELLISRTGHPGHECVLRSICEISTFPFQNNGGLLIDIIHILFIPSTSIDKITDRTSHDYLQAEKYGKLTLDCKEIYGKCKISLIDKISHFLFL